MHDFTYLTPSTIPELMALLHEHSSQAKILAGGTDLLVRMKGKICEPDYLIDLKRIEELQRIEVTEEGISIGAAVPLVDVATNSTIMEQYPFFAEAISLLGSVQIRNKGTLIGNICNASPLADTVPSLMVLGAKLKVASIRGVYSLPLEKFFVGPGQTILKPDEFIQEVFIPFESGRGIYLKHSRRKEVDLASVSVAVFYNGQEYRIALGAVAPTPIRALEGEKFLHEHGLTSDTLVTAAELVEKSARPITDIRSTEEYRREMVNVLTKRALGIILTATAR